MRPNNWITDLAKDLAYAARSLGRTPAFAATAILTIALGIGVNTAVFHVIHTVLLDPLPYRDPQRLVHVAETHPDFPAYQVAAPDFFDWRRSASSFEAMAAHTFQAMNKWVILGDGEPEPVQVVQASHTLYPMLGVQPLLGRTYTAEEEAGKSPVVVIGESLWRRKYGADPSIVGRRIRLVGWAVTVVGVVSTRHAQPSWADVWMPLTFLDVALTEARRFHTLEVVARLKPGVTIPQAQAEMHGIAGRLARDYPDSNSAIGAVVLPLSAWLTGQVRPALLIAWGAVSLVLLIACANVAHLVMVRSVHRSREMAVRAALGAGAGRLTRFLLAENLAVAAAGGTLGALLARAALPVLTRIAAIDIPRLEPAELTPETLFFGAGATILCALLIALPAVVVSRRPDLHQIIKQSGGRSLSHRRSWFPPTVIAAEIALAFVVMAGAALLYRSFVALIEEDVGFDARGVVAVNVPLAFDWPTSARVYDQQVAPRLREIPGVTTVAAANLGPMTLDSAGISRFTTHFSIAGRTFDSHDLPLAQIRWITPEYFDLLRIPLFKGRKFTEKDGGHYIINQALARRYFPGEDPIGKQIRPGLKGTDARPAAIIGVVGDVRDLGLDLAPRPTLYQLSVSNMMTVLVRTRVDPASVVPQIRRTLRAINPDAPIRLLAPLERIVEDSLTKRKFALELLGVFAALAVVLTAVGVYGVISYSLSGRTTEFAIRFALGAERRHVRALILRGFAIPTLAGLLVGGWLAWLFARTLETQLYKLTPHDPIVLAGTAASLVLLVLVSALRPVAKAAATPATAVPRE